MNVRPISAPLAGEHVISVEPALAYPHVDGGWMRRLRLFQGRALDAVALSNEQRSRASKLTLLGLTRSPGVVTGLEVALDVEGTTQVLHVAPGIGLAATGEDIVLGHELRVPLDALGPIGANVRAGILTLIPTLSRVVDRFDTEDPCAIDETELAFSDEQMIDGLRVELVPWTHTALDANSARRNQLAYTIFDAERQLGAGEVAPWQVNGLPIALVGIEAGKITYVDRYAVVRTGGDPIVRTPLVVDASRRAGAPALWQARIEQLIDHVSDLRAADGTLPTAIAAQLERIPPAGVLPRDVIDRDVPYANRFFPPQWRLRAVPIPMEQLDGMLASSASLAPLSTQANERVLVLVPVPQAVFEPRLLEREQPSPEFATSINKFIGDRAEWLGRRSWLRKRRDALMTAIEGDDYKPDYPNPDPEALEPNEPSAADLQDTPSDYETVDVAGQLFSKAIVALQTRVVANTKLTEEERKTLPKLGLVAYIAALETRLRVGNDAVDFGFLRAQSDIYRMRQFMLGSQLATKLATSPALAAIAQGETASLVREDLSSLLASLKTKVTPPAPTTPPRAGPISLARPTAAVHLQPTPSEERVSGAVGHMLARPEGRELVLGVGGLGVRPETIRPDVVIATKPDDIRESSPLVGAPEIRNVTVSERLEPPRAPETKNFALASRHESVMALETLANAGMNVGDISVFGIPIKDDPEGKRTFTSFADAKAAGLDKLLADREPKTSDEAAYFHDTVSLVEAHVSTLRQLEGRIAAYRAVLKDCQATLAAVRATLAQANARMAVVQDELRERRQNLATARSLETEEKARVAAINRRRVSVLAEHVTMIGYVRTRHVTGLVDAAEIVLDPALLDSPVPACIGGHGDAPSELDEMVALLREAPLAWFKLGPKLLDHFDRTELLHGAILNAKTRAVSTLQTGFATKFTLDDGVGRFAKTIGGIGRSQVDAVLQPRAQVADVDLRSLVGLSWVESRDVAKQIVSIADLVAGVHIKTAATQSAYALIANIDKVAGCLWAQVSEVVPEVRLAWADALDQFDGAHRTLILASLPRWEKVPYQTRKSIEVLADWLIDHVDRTIPAAVTFMHDLVRACILLASHAPVDRLISGAITAPAPASPGMFIPVMIDPVHVKLGMQVTFFKGTAAIAHGVVEDLVADRAKTRVIQASSTDVRVDTTTVVRFAKAGSPLVTLGR